MGFLAAGLMVFNPWLILLLLVAVVPAFLGESYFKRQESHSPDARTNDGAQGNGLYPLPGRQ